jgi:hypothetical protein
MTTHERIEPEDGEHEDLYDVIESSTGMSLARIREIEQADTSDKPLDLSAEERAQYEESKEELSKVMASLRVTLNETLEPINKRLKGIIAQSYAPIAIARPREPVMPESHDLSSMYDGIAEAAAERSQREQTNASNIADTAMVMQELLTTVQNDSNTSTTRWWWMLGIAALTLIAAAVAAVPPIIDWLNG